jgi:hypothetical protein
MILFSFFWNLSPQKPDPVEFTEKTSTLFYHIIFLQLQFISGFNLFNDYPVSSGEQRQLASSGRATPSGMFDVLVFLISFPSLPWQRGEAHDTCVSRYLSFPGAKLNTKRKNRQPRTIPKILKKKDLKSPANRAPLSTSVERGTPLKNYYHSSN